MLSITLLILITSCATLARPGEETALQVIELINTGDGSELKKISADTVLFDSEVLHGPILIASLWDGLTESGFTMEEATVVESRPPASADMPLFGEGSGVETFFSRYIPDNSMLFRIASENNSIVLVLGPVEDGTAEIIAFGGPF